MRNHNAPTGGLMINTFQSDLTKLKSFSDCKYKYHSFYFIFFVYGLYWGELGKSLLEPLTQGCQSAVNILVQMITKQAKFCFKRIWLNNDWHPITLK